MLSYIAPTESPSNKSKVFVIASESNTETTVYVKQTKVSRNFDFYCRSTNGYERVALNCNFVNLIVN